jgi:outer membrane protein OmpA-like peptidoglycan-associated protein
MIRFLILLLVLVHPLNGYCQENQMENGRLVKTSLTDTTEKHNTIESQNGQESSAPIILNILKDNWTSFFPMGAVSFADSVIDYDPGSLGKHADDEPPLKYQNYQASVGTPDYDAVRDTGSVSLGMGGYIVLKFCDNLLIDGYGPDLYISLSDSASEEVHVLISQDGRIFQSVGTVSKYYPVINIAPYTEPGTRYAYVKLRDNPDQGDKQSLKSGADIDAVGAINTAMVFVIPADLLIQYELTQLDSSAKTVLSPIAAQIRQFPGSTVWIEAHTDSRGAADYNLILSQQWSGLIRNYLIDQEHLDEVAYRTTGFGESRPVASNESEKGRRKNRRIEILIIR